MLYTCILMFQKEFQNDTRNIVGLRHEEKNPIVTSVFLFYLCIYILHVLSNIGIQRARFFKDMCICVHY